MHQPIERYFKIGLIAAMAFPDYGADAAAAARTIAKDPYFHALELNPVADAAQRETIAGIAEQAHLTVCYGAQARLLSTGLNPNDLDESKRKKAEQTLLEGVDEAVSLGAKGMAFLSGKWEPESREPALSQLRRTTLAVCRYAAEKGVHIELEVFDYDIDKASLVGPATLAARFAAEIRTQCANFGLLADLSHFPMCYEDSCFILSTLRPYITHLHMGNTVIGDEKAEAYGDEHPRFGFPNSENDVQELILFLKALKQEGFFCKENPFVLSFEVKPRPQEDLHAVIANSKRVLNRAWALL